MKTTTRTMNHPFRSGLMRVATIVLACLLAHQAVAQVELPASNMPQRLADTDRQAEGTAGLLDRFQQTAEEVFADRSDAALTTDEEPLALEDLLRGGPSDWTGRSGILGSLSLLMTVSVLSLAPAILLMTTCYVRIVVVMGLLRQALGTGQLPSTQIITSISLFMTLFIMSPVWEKVYTDSIQPYTAEGSTMSLDEAWEAGVAPIREFMSRQIDVVDNEDDVHLFYQHYNPGATPLASWEEVPLQVLLPAYLLSELKTAFLMGFMIFLPFLIIDLVVASVTISMGMMMLPPAMISLPFKLLLFVLVDGWHLVVGMLLDSFATIAT